MASIKIFDRHEPALKAGYYKIDVIQTLVAGTDSTKAELDQKEFKIESEQYAITEQQVDSVFPPHGSIGDFSLALPHIILNRSTFPWEREAQKNNPEKPWLALLLFNEDEAGTLDNAQNLPSQLDKDKYYSVHINKTDWEKEIFSKPLAPVAASDTKENLISAIVMSTDYLNKNILPSFNELSLLSHVRSNITDGIEKAVVVSNRLPKKDARNIVHLVSLEDCFDSTGELIAKKFNENSTSFTAMVSLKSWSFFCNDHFIVTEEVLKNFNTYPELINALNGITNNEYFKKDDFINALNLTPIPNKETLKLLFDTFRIGHLPHILKHLNRTPSTLLSLPENGFSTQGFISLPYSLDNGKKIDALYRGPFIPVKITDSTGYVILSNADKAFRYLTAGNSKSLDCSYASAWELGRMLALQNKKFSIALFQWKRECYHAYKLRDKTGYKHLTGAAPKSSYPAASQLITDWFNDIKLLKGVPYNYLMPHPDMLPFESIRFFMIDENWIKHLIDGAFSIARISDLDMNCDRELYDDFEFLNVPTGIRSGLLLHSVAVSGWPNLIFKCSYNPVINNEDLLSLPDNVENIPIRRDKLSHNILVSIFNANKDSLTKSISIYQKPDSVHFGVDEGDKGYDIKYNNDVGSLIFYSTPTGSIIKTADGNYYSANDGTKIKLDKFTDEEKIEALVLNAKKIDLIQLTVDLGKPSAAQLANFLVAKIEAVTFNLYQ